MKSIFLAAAAIIGFAASAAAADAVTELPVASTYNWTGVYAGVQAAYIWGDGTQTYANGDYSAPKPSGFLGGAYLGVNYQLSNNVVIGLEGDWAWTDAKDTSLYFHSNSAPYGSNYQSALDVDWTAGLRGRIGYATGRWLPYVAGGLAVARVNYVGYDSGAVFDPGAAKTLAGWTIGAGAEYAFTDNLIGRAEYRYSDFGSADFSNSYAPSEKVGLTSSDVRIGFAYKF